MTSEELYQDPPTSAPDDPVSGVVFKRFERSENRLLESNAKSVRAFAKKTPKNRVDLRAERWAAMSALWTYSSIKRVRKCKRVTIRPMGTVDVRKSSGSGAEDKVGFAGLATCGSVWACPLCSARIQAVRRLELGVLVAVAAAAGLTIAFGTMTLRHKPGQPLAMLWDAMNNANRGVTNAKRVSRLRKTLGRAGYVRATEVTHGQNGWHPHIHTLQLFEAPVTQAQLDELANAEFEVWKKQAVKRGLGAPLRDHYKLDLVTDASVEFADYFAKGVYDPSVARSAKSMSFEMSSNATKKARAKGSRTPFQILGDIVKQGDADDLELWEEYELASKGRRALVWSPGLRKLMDIEELTDEQIAEEQVGSEEDVLFSVADWSPIAAQPRLGGLLLSAVARGGLSAGLDFCREHGILTLDADDPDVVEDREMYEEMRERPK